MTDAMTKGCERLAGSISRGWPYPVPPLSTALAADPGLRGLVDACNDVPRILYGLGLDARQAKVAQRAIDVCRAAVKEFADGGR